MSGRKQPLGGAPDGLVKPPPTPAPPRHDRPSVIAPHGWVRVETYGSKWHRATKDLRAACGAGMRARGDIVHEDSPTLEKFHNSHSVCVACFRSAIGLEPCCPKCGRME